MMKRIIIVVCVLLLGACGSAGKGFSFLHDRRDSATITLDEQIVAGAYTQLQKAEAIKDRAQYTIYSYNSVVLIIGEAETEQVREIIVANVRIVPGIKLIHNQLVVAPPLTEQQRTEDAQLAVSVNEALSDVSEIDADQLVVLVENKGVYLMGLVNKDEAQMAASAVQQVAGVRKIITVFEYIENQE